MYNTTEKSGYNHGEACYSGLTSSSLVDLETTVRATRTLTAAQARFFDGLEKERTKIIGLLMSCDFGQHQSRIRRMLECSSVPIIVKAVGDIPKLVVGRCRDRMCPRCSRINAYKCAKKLSGVIKLMNEPRAITLTLKHSPGNLQSQIDRLMDAWRKLRKEQSWKSHVTGGVYSLEITYDSKSETWHPHLHVIVDGVFYQQKELSDVWCKVTKGSSIVDIRAVHSVQGVSEYISKYVTKPAEVAGWADSVLYEYMEAIRGRRLFHTFGVFHNVEVVDNEPKLMQKDGPGYASIGRIIKGDSDGIVECELAIDYLRLAPKKWRIAFGLPTPDCAQDPLFRPVINEDHLHLLLQAATDSLDPKPPPEPQPAEEPPTLFPQFNNKVSTDYSRLR